jgi:hypothetical protein
MMFNLFGRKKYVTYGEFFVRNSEQYLRGIFDIIESIIRKIWSGERAVSTPKNLDKSIIVFLIVFDFYESIKLRGGTIFETTKFWKDVEASVESMIRRWTDLKMTGEDLTEYAHVCLHDLERSMAITAEKHRKGKLKLRSPFGDCVAAILLGKSPDDFDEWESAFAAILSGFLMEQLSMILDDTKNLHI